MGSEKIGHGITQRRNLNQLQALLGGQPGGQDETQNGSQGVNQGQAIAGGRPEFSPMRAAQTFHAAEKALGKGAATALTDAMLEQNKFAQKQQAVRGAEDREEIRKFQEPYKDISKLQKNRNNLVEAKKILQSPKFGQGFLRKVGIGLAEGKDHGDIAKLFKTPEEQQLFHLLRPFLESREVGGTNPSTREVLISMSSLPSLFNDPQANEFIVDSMINDVDRSLDMGTTINKLRQSNPNISFADLAGQVDSQVGERQAARQQEFAQSSMERSAKNTIKSLPIESGKVWMMLPDGTPGKVDRNNVNQAIGDGAILLQ